MKRVGRLGVSTLAFALIGVAGGVGVVLACGPFISNLRAVTVSRPANLESYGRGELGVVKPKFFRVYLAQAYRVLNDRPPIAANVRPNPGPAVSSTPGQLRDDVAPSDEWADLVASLRGPLSREQRYELISQSRSFSDYQFITNCLDDAYATATRTLQARIARYGRASREVGAWLEAQLAVFRNCGGDGLVLPADAPPWADELLRADRRYQVAAAHFYAMRYDEAATLFRAIGEETDSPWQPYGRFLAARALIRGATVPADGRERATELLTRAEADLRDVVADASAGNLRTGNRPLAPDAIAALADCGALADAALT